jgi:NlpC/P60 family
VFCGGWTFEAAAAVCGDVNAPSGRHGRHASLSTVAGARAATVALRAHPPLPGAAVDQFNATVPVGDPQPGDLVFFANTYEPGISHVGIYIGDGLQINAPTTGQVVSAAPVFTGYWGSHYAGARRVRAWTPLELVRFMTPSLQSDQRRPSSRRELSFLVRCLQK